MRSFFILSIENSSQIIEIFFGKLFILREMDQERFDRTVEEAVNKALALGMNALLLRNKRVIMEEILVFVCAEGLFPGQASEQSFDGVWMPVFLFGKGLNNVSEFCSTLA